MSASRPDVTEISGEHGSWLAGRIVVGVDGSDGSIAALRHALRIASVTGARIEAAIVWQYEVNVGALWAPLELSPDRDAGRVLRETVRSVTGTKAPVRLRYVVRKGSAPANLIELSNGADLLVVGRRGTGGFAGLLLGSVSAACAEHANCPVLIVPGNVVNPG